MDLDKKEIKYQPAEPEEKVTSILLNKEMKSEDKSTIDRNRKQESINEISPTPNPKYPADLEERVADVRLKKKKLKNETPEEREHRLNLYRKYYQRWGKLKGNRLKTETPEQRVRRLEQGRKYYEKRGREWYHNRVKELGPINPRLTETAEQRDNRLSRCRKYYENRGKQLKKVKRENETMEQRERRLKRGRELYTLARERKDALKKQQTEPIIIQSITIDSETFTTEPLLIKQEPSMDIFDDHLLQRQAKDLQNEKRRLCWNRQRMNETSDERELRLAKTRSYFRQYRAANRKIKLPVKETREERELRWMMETPAEREKRQQRNRKSNQRITENRRSGKETPDQRERRLNRAREYNKLYKRKNKPIRRKKQAMVQDVMTAPSELTSLLTENKL